MASVGMPELIIVLVITGFYLVPIGAAVWAIVTLRRIRAEQRTVQLRLDTIERLLQRS